MKFFLKKISVGCRLISAERSGQSLLEIVIALAVGAILIGGAVLAIWVIIDSTIIGRQQQTATFLAQEYTAKIRSFAASDWSAIYSLATTSANPHFLVSSSTRLIVVPGKEGVLDSDIRSGLVAHWGMDESTGLVAYDTTINNHNGTLIENPTRTENCRVGGCLSFSTGKYVDVGDVGSGIRTVAFWMKSNASSGGILGSDGTVVISLSSNNISLSGFNSPTVYVNGTITQQAGLGEWFYVVVTSESINLSNLRVGQGGGVGFDGQIDDVRIYNRVLSSDEIEHLYGADVFVRHFYTENVCRAENFDIAGTVPCMGSSTEDPTILKITTVIEWPAKRGGKTNEFVLEDYVTRWQSQIFDQTDWSGGIDCDTAYGGPTNTYCDSENIEITAKGGLKVILTPGQPGTTTYSNVSTSTLTVNWTAPSDGGSPDYYGLERSINDIGSFSEIATTTELFYNDSGLSTSTVYWYRVRATNSIGTGPYSTSTDVTTGAE